MADDTQEPQNEQGQDPVLPQEGGDGEGQSQSSINHEIARLTRKEAEGRQVNAALLAAIEKMGQPKQSAPPSPEEDAGPPKRENFPDDFAFFEAQQQHALKGMETKVSKLVEEQIQTRRQAFEQEHRDATLRQSYNKGLQKHPDFDAVVQASATTITDSMVSMMSEHDDPEDIYYYLGQTEHKSEAARIATLSPARQAHEIGKIADQIKAKRPDPMEPMKPLSGGGAPAPSLYDTTSPSSDRLSDDEWFRREDQRLRGKMGG